MKRRILLGLLGAALGLCLSGCVFEPVDKLYALPVLPQEYRDLQSTIDATMSELGAEYATISYGSNTSTIQLLDMDGDGEQETAAVFLRVTAPDEKPMRVCLFRQDGGQTYRQLAMLSGEGASINSVAYEDLTGDGSREMIVSWQLSAGVHLLSAYNFTGSGANELMRTTYNEGYATVDLDQDGSRELLVFQQDATGEGYNLAEYYDYVDGMMVMVSSAPLSDGLKNVVRAESGLLSDGVPGVYVTLEIENGFLTDVLTLGRSGLKNVTRDEESGVSLATAWTNTEATTADVNGDGVLEIPRPQLLTPPYEENSSSQYLIYWQQVDSRGRSATSGITYHSFTDGWRLTLPNGWDINSITVARDDSLSGRGERAVVFYHWPGRAGKEPERFLTIYRLTGSNRVSRSKQPGRVVLYSDSNTIYCASLDQSAWPDSGLDEAGLAQRFQPITAAWSSR